MGEEIIAEIPEGMRKEVVDKIAGCGQVSRASRVSAPTLMAFFGNNALVTVPSSAYACDEDGAKSMVQDTLKTGACKLRDSDPKQSTACGCVLGLGSEFLEWADKCKKTIPEGMRKEAEERIVECGQVSPASLVSAPTL